VIFKARIITRTGSLPEPAIAFVASRAWKQRAFVEGPQYSTSSLLLPCNTELSTQSYGEQLTIKLEYLQNFLTNAFDKNES
jgi:hypothetical protein